MPIAEDDHRSRSREKERNGYCSGRERDDSHMDSSHRYVNGVGLNSLIVRGEPAVEGLNEFEPGEIRPSSASYRRNRFSDAAAAGYDMDGRRNYLRAGSHSPRHRIPEPYVRDYDQIAPHHDGRFRGGRGHGRFEYRPTHQNPPRSMGRGTEFYGREFPEPGYGYAEPLNLEGESMRRNDPNVTPREGDWICSEPTCGNLNFARRKECNKCDRPRSYMAPFGMGAGGPPGGFPLPRPPFMGGPPMGRGPGRGMGDFRPTLGGRGRDGPQVFDRMPPPRLREWSPPDFYSGKQTKERRDYDDRYNYKGRERPEKISPVGRGPVMDHRDKIREDRKGDRDVGHIMDHRYRIREDRFHDRRGNRDARSDWRPPSPLPRSRLGRGSRERSRSPVRSPPRNYNRDSYVDGLRDKRRDGRRGRPHDGY